MLNLAAWSAIDTPDFIINLLTEGIRIPFKIIPETIVFNNHSLNELEETFVQQELERLLKLGYIKTVDKNPGFVSPIGCVPKQNGKYRLIIDLRHLNNHCVHKVHKLDDIRCVEQLLKPKDVLTSIDLKDSFYHFKIHKDYEKFLSFKFKNVFYSFTVLPFGFCLSPYFHTKILRPVVTYLRNQNVRVNLYVDDFLLCCSEKLYRDHTDLVMHTLQDLGLRINLEKSEIEGSQSLNYLGYIIDTTGDFPVIRVQKKRIRRLKRQICVVLRQKVIKARTLAKTAGLCVSTAWTVSPGKLFLRNIYKLLSQKHSWNDYLILNDNCVRELKWWLESVDSFNLKEIRPRPIDIQLEVDASKKCWGAVLGTQEAKGDWNNRVSKQSSNYRELLAILMGLETFKGWLKNKTVEILSDNSTAGAYVRNKGGPVLQLTELAIAIWGIAESNGIWIVCTHIPGVKNIAADSLSRSPDIHNWMLHPELFKIIQHKFGPFTIDRFASSLNAQLPRFNSRFWEPGTEALNAMAQDWSQDHNYINPPWAMLPRILEKVIADQAECTIIAPMFRAQPWFQILQKLSVHRPFLLPKHANTTCYIGPERAEPKRNKSWQLAAWRVSGKYT